MPIPVEGRLDPQLAPLARASAGTMLERSETLPAGLHEGVESRAGTHVMEDGGGGRGGYASLQLGDTGGFTATSVGESCARRRHGHGREHEHDDMRGQAEVAAHSDDGSAFNAHGRPSALLLPSRPRRQVTISLGSQLARRRTSRVAPPRRTHSRRANPGGHTPNLVSMAL